MGEGLISWIAIIARDLARDPKGQKRASLDTVIRSVMILALDPDPDSVFHPFGDSDAITSGIIIAFWRFRILIQ